MIGSGNIAAHLPALARSNPYALAVACPCGTGPGGKLRYTLTNFRDLDRLSDAAARGLGGIGIRRGMRTVLMVTPGLDFFVLTFALFKAGAVPVMVDPGMGVPSLGRCLAQAEPEAFIGIPKAHFARRLLGWARRSVRLTVTTGRLRLGATATLAQVLTAGASAGAYEPIEPRPDEMAAILYTSGSTGPPKGAVYTHPNFQAQVNALRDDFGIRPGEVDLCTFPLFALFAPALGMASVVPDMDATRPALADPVRITQAIEDFGVTNLFGSPALIRRVGGWGAERGLKLGSLRRVISSGAPVPAGAIERFCRMLPPGAQLWTGYGATESLPVCALGSDEILGETRALTDQGKGVCVGRPVGGATVRVVPITDAPFRLWTEDLPVPPGQVGEIAVNGPMVTAQYWRLPLATELAKIPWPEGPAGRQLWHRIGDLGYFDECGRLWFCGRKTQRVATPDAPGGEMYTIPTEAVFNTHPAVFRTALVGVRQNGRVRPVLCVELNPEAGRTDPEKLRAELRALGTRHEHTRAIETFLVHPGFPVDTRHNAKIGREQLAIWAEERLRS